MNTVIVYVSLHHGSTKKLVDAIAAKHDVTLLNAATTPIADLANYDLIGGLNKAHPDDQEIKGAVEFFERL